MLDFGGCPHYNDQADKLTDFVRAIRSCRVVGRARTIGNRVGVKSSSRVRISPTPPERKSLPLAGSFFFACGEIRIYIEHASGMFIIQFSNWMIPLFFARCLLCPNATPSLAKNAGESLQLRHKRQVILIELPAFSFCQKALDFRAFPQYQNAVPFP